MRLIILCLTALLLLIQYPLWLGKGGWLRVWDLDQQVIAARKKNDELKARNAKLTSEVQDLKEGTGAVEERARYELGMIKENEIFVQVLEPNGKPAVVQNISQPVATSNSNSRSQGAMHPEKGLPLTVQKGLPSVVGRQ